MILFIIFNLFIFIFIIIFFYYYIDYFIYLLFYLFCVLICVLGVMVVGFVFFGIERGFVFVELGGLLGLRFEGERVRVCEIIYNYWLKFVGGKLLGI